MAGRFVRQSKYRHVFGTGSKQELQFQGTKLTNTAWDTDFIKVNTKYFALVWSSTGGGVFAIIPLDKPGKQVDVPLIMGHKGAVLDIDFNPFDEEMIASVSEDCGVYVWQFPEGGLTENISQPVQKIMGHRRKVGTCNFNPVASRVLATSSADFTVKIWDIEQGEELYSVGGHTDIVQSVDWNDSGSLIASACRDKKLRILDPRQQSVVQENVAHQGVKGIRVKWLTGKDYVMTTGFTKTSEREFNIFDPKSMDKPLAHLNIDTGSGVLMPFYDYETSMVYLAGKGDGNVRYYEIVDEKPFYYFVSEYRSSHPQRGMGMLPKRAVNVNTCEVTRLYKVLNDRVDPISFSVPRKSDLFQDDIFPDTYAGIPAMTLKDFTSGARAVDPIRNYSHAPGYVAPVRPKETFTPVMKEDEGPKSEKELRDEFEKLKIRVAYLEAELLKKDVLIKELQQT